MSAPEETPQSRIAETAPPDATAGLDPLPPKPPQDGPALDLQAIRLTGVAATPIVEQLRRPGARRDQHEDAEVLDQALDGLVKLADEVERLSHEVTTREAAARHALDATTQARQEADRLRAELEQAQDDRAEAYLVEAQCWDLLEDAKRYVDGGVADPTDHERRHLAGLIEHQLTAEPPAIAQALWGELRTARTVVDAARAVPDLLGEGHFSAEAIDLVKARLVAALAAHDQTLKAGGGQ